MYIDFKITNWERVLIPNELEKQVLELLKNKTVESSSDLYNEVDGDLLTITTIDEVEEQMSVEDNDGCSTIEAYNDEGETLFENGEKSDTEPKIFTENDMKEFGLWLGNNLKKSKGKTIDELFDTFKTL